ncbi:MAG TPA: N-6 DNA methylase [Kofleriaceae bacterium]
MPTAREHARPLGVVYTPREVAEPMVRLALEPLLRGKRSDELLALRICDPALGEGAFLVEVVRVLAEAVRAAWHAEGSLRNDAERAVATHCIAGVDIDPRAVEVARHALGVERELRVGDALALDWSRTFPGGFDAVVGNPPYIRQEQLDKSGLAGFACYDGVADLYVYFIELAHQILRPGGRFCLITPNKWLTTAYGRPLRGFLAERGSIEGVIDLSRQTLFAGADAFSSIVWGRTGVPLGVPIRAARIAPGIAVADALAAGTPHPRERWATEPWNIDDPEDRALIDRLAATWPVLGDLVGKPSRGIVTGYNRAFVVDRATRDRLAEDPAAAALIRPFVKGRDLARFIAKPAERWILMIDRGTEPPPSILAYLTQFRPALEPGSGRKPGNYRWYELQDPVGALAASREPRLLYQDIQTGPLCCLDRSGLVPDTTVWILPTADRYLLAVLNSSLYGWYARRRFPPALNGAVRPKLPYIRAFPIATPSPALRRDIEALVDQRLAGDPEVDAALADAVLDAYQLTAAERQLATGR